MDLGRVGIWTPTLDGVPAAEAGRLAAEVEAMGYGALWYPEVAGRDAMVNAALLLAATGSLKLCSGIASIWARDALAAACAHKTIEEAFPGRFLLGLGVSHAPAVEDLRGQSYDRPFSTMVAYLDAMDAAPYFALAPVTEPQRALAALGPRMLALAAERGAGAHPYLVPVEHTPVARATLDEAAAGVGRPRPLLAPEQACVLETDPAEARRIARDHMARYLALPNYTNNLRRLGWGDADLDGGGSDRLVDAIVAWGTVDAIAARVRAHLEAGADHVCIQLLPADGRTVPVDGWRTLAPTLTTMPA